MNDKPTLEELLEIQEHFGLPSPALVEKDWYVVKALAAIAAAETAPFRLVFGGGTALSRAYGLLRRMSEDIDLKIVSEKKPSRRALGNLHSIVTDALLDAGFAFDPAKPEHRTSMYKNSFTRYQLPYAAITEGKGVLRAEIQIEISARPLRRPSIDRSVRSFVAEAFRPSRRNCGDRLRGNPGERGGEVGRADAPGRRRTRGTSEGARPDLSAPPA